MDFDNTQQVNNIDAERRARIAAREKRRKVMRMRRIRAAIIFSLIILFILFEIIVHLPVFDIDTIAVKGNDEISAEEIIKASNIKKGDGLYSLDKEEAAQKICKLPRMKSCEIKKDYPSGVIIAVEERKPIAYLSKSKKFFILDKDGVCLDTLSKAPKLTFIEGIKFVKGKKSNIKGDKNLNIALKIVNLSIKEKLFFKKVIFVKNEIRLYALDDLYITGDSGDIVKSLKNGQLSVSVYKLYESDVEKGTLLVTRGGDFILSP